MKILSIRVVDIRGGVSIKALIHPESDESPYTIYVWETWVKFGDIESWASILRNALRNILKPSVEMLRGKGRFFYIEDDEKLTRVRIFLSSYFCDKEREVTILSYPEAKFVVDTIFEKDSLDDWEDELF